MRGIAQVALAASLIVGVTAQPHQHQHRHLHAKNHARSPVEKREGDVTVTAVVPGPTVVEYKLGDQTIDSKEAEEGLSDGLFIVVGETTPTFVPPPPPPPPTTSSASVPTDAGAQFFEKKKSSSAPAPVATPSPAAPAVPSGIDANFPSGKIPCSHFPSDYGALAIDWVGTQGWTSLQVPDSYVPGVSIKNIVAPISGGCSKGMFCSYACPPGYQKTQWPETQGATGQSVGGLWCNSNGFLELTRPSHPRICEQGVGNVFVQNKMSGSAAVCRTDYPASENMVIPLDTKPGGHYELTNPSSNDYYMWQGKPTTAQYYVNRLNLAVQDACTWTSSVLPDAAGNWAPTNIGLGRDAFGVTWISIFPNLPTSHATLNFNIEITGDVNSQCALKNGVYTGGGNGCTTAISSPNGTATIVFTN
ncbi:hypothetical protein QBC33DRAFT_371417 [Phialemonium atrogriseum]|uniref:Uncharacterized protein n=1 Tax=Phialemonium atrogriseum TaxID=1093897 RepID=A0AAJ0C441_9PEZI|nr:uncharacterized protein QBC33DRAFT_371417 [Phialemonium atrogriseum]KAK1768322.1 hypothetical protein QBC33DRAFT_371417 [Phialemonium atrogriseum]